MNLAIFEVLEAKPREKKCGPWVQNQEKNFVDLGGQNQEKKDVYLGSKTKRKKVWTLDAKPREKRCGPWKQNQEKKSVDLGQIPREKFLCFVIVLFCSYV